MFDFSFLETDSNLTVFKGKFTLGIFRIAHSPPHQSAIYQKQNHLEIVRILAEQSDIKLDFKASQSFRIMLTKQIPLKLSIMLVFILLIKMLLRIR